jgi:hypothetical protein
MSQLSGGARMDLAGKSWRCWWRAPSHSCDAANEFWFLYQITIRCLSQTCKDPLSCSILFVGLKLWVQYRRNGQVFPKVHLCNRPRLRLCSVRRNWREPSSANNFFYWMELGRVCFPSGTSSKRAVECFLLDIHLCPAFSDVED